MMTFILLLHLICYLTYFSNFSLGEWALTHALTIELYSNYTFCEKVSIIGLFEWLVSII